MKEGMCDMCDVGGCSELSGFEVLGRGVWIVRVRRGVCAGVAMNGISPQRRCGEH